MSGNKQYTISEFIENPFGKGNAAISTRTNRGEYIRRYSELAKKGKTCRLHSIAKSKDRWFLLIKVPSENVDKELYYDVMVEFYPINKTFENTKYLSKYAVRFYSNSPSFTYTFMRVYKKYGLLIKELEDKIPEKFLIEDPNTRNPFGIINYDKTIFFALHFLLTADNGRLLQKEYLDSLKQRSLSDMIKDAENPDEKMVNIKKEDLRLKELIKEKAQEDKNKINSIEYTVKREERQYKKNRSKVTPKTKITPKASRVKKSKYVKKIGGRR